MGTISRITLGQGLSLGDLWQQLRHLLKGRYVEVWADVFEEGVYWVADEARAALEEVKIPFKLLNQISVDRVKVFHAPHLEPDPASLPNVDSVRARVLAGHGVGAVLFFIGDGQQMPPEEPTSPKDALFYLSKPGAGYYYLWRLFRSKEDAEHYVVQRFTDDEGAKRWVASIPVLAYGELLQDADKEGQP
jgi:hypothetical protein